MVEGARLESVYTGNRIAGSNPALSATFKDVLRRIAMSRPLLFAAALGAAVFSTAPASAFYCYVPEKPGGPIPLRERPNDKAKVVVMMPPGGMVRLVPSRRSPEDWVQVRWEREAQSGKYNARGWTRRLDIHGGECED